MVCPAVQGRTWKGAAPEALARVRELLLRRGAIEDKDLKNPHETWRVRIEKTVFTGYLPREARPDIVLPHEVLQTVERGPFVLVTPGGGGDGADLVGAVLSAYERYDERLPWPALVVYGEEDPVTPPDVVDALVDGIPSARRAGIARAAHLANVEQPEAFGAAVLTHLDERIAA